MALLPLRIFERRYMAMVADVLERDQRLGMVLLRSGWEADYDGRPPIYSIGCSGVIVNAAKLDDGRYNIVLRGLERIHILDEDHERPYRRATVKPLPDASLDDRDRQALNDVRGRIGALLGFSQSPSGEAGVSAAERLAAMPDADFMLSRISTTVGGKSLSM